MRRRSAVTGALALFLASAPAAAQDSWSAPFPGVRRLHRVTPGQDINVLVVDLCAPGVSMRATTPSEGHRTVVDFGNLVGAQAVINGAFYDPRDWRRMDGMAMGQGMLWGGPDHDYTGPVGFGAGRAAIVAHNIVAGPEPWMRQIVSGHPSVVIDGAVTDSRGDTTLCPRNPRTAVGLSADHRTFYMAVVDGRAPSRIGMTCNELGDFMLGLGARDAINLDGGGSSAMWLRGVGVVNHPSDGSLRAAANHLALYATGSGPPGHCPGAAPTCAPRCEGSVLVGADCGRGDCGAFGSRCVNDALGARCAFALCPDRGETDICFASTRYGHCRDGALPTQGDCAATGGRCVLSGGRASCVPSGCPASGTSRVCVDDAHLGDCSGGRLTGTGDCSAFGARCVQDDLGARCVFVFCPTRGEADICWDRTRVGHCSDGALTSQGDCAAFAAFCSTAGASGGRCVSAFCAAGPEMAPVAHDACWITPGQLLHCDANGGPRTEACPAGQQCSAIGGAHCVAAVCPTTGMSELCLDARLLGHCDSGSVTDAMDCSRGGGRCVTDASGAHCEAPAVMDAGAVDVPAAVDSGAVDVPAAAVDAGARDAGATPDRGVPLTEAGMSYDAGGEVVGTVVDGGCGCRAGGSPTRPGGARWLWVLALVAVCRRRRISGRGGDAGW